MLNLKNMVKKDLIKIENEIDLDLRVLALLDDNLTINIIDNEKIIEKVELKLPESFVGLFKCKNPRCVSVNERILNQNLI